ncbi:cytochrome c oxidase subunit 2A [Brevibacillus sp. TJ4]|uniref:cytochrome c oxidase subunit 2A n=1 Tax=Brevibacillus sp. TJ4 TaxID=3234853 RepID=UPI003BA384CB
METQHSVNREGKMPEQTQPQQENLKGTLASVLIVGAVILLSWFGIFGLFLDRA